MLLKNKKMQQCDSFTDFIIDQLTQIGNIQYRHMFNSFGLYYESLFFGLTNESRLFLKTNAVTSKQYKAAGMTPFTPSAKQCLKNYLEVPAEILEDHDKLTTWALQAIDIARTA